MIVSAVCCVSDRGPWYCERHTGPSSGLPQPLIGTRTSSSNQQEHLRPPQRGNCQPKPRINNNFSMKIYFIFYNKDMILQMKGLLPIMVSSSNPMTLLSKIDLIMFVLHVTDQVCLLRGLIFTMIAGVFDPFMYVLNMTAESSFRCCFKITVGTGIFHFLVNISDMSDEMMFNCGLIFTLITPISHFLMDSCSVS